ncbi:MAG: hypothetical protein ACRBBJ_08980 [Rhodomicrobiaceae bacterium]
MEINKFWIFKGNFKSSLAGENNDAKMLLGLIFQSLASSGDARQQLLQKAVDHAGNTTKAITHSVQDNFCRGKGDEDIAWAFYFHLHHIIPAGNERLNEIDRILLDGDTFEEATGFRVIDLPSVATGTTTLASANNSTSQPPLWLPEEEYLEEDNSNWLNPAVVDALPFIGREKELKQLTEFATSDSKFQVWALSGPSGAGKTRLTINWMREFLKNKNRHNTPDQLEWHIGFLDQSAQEVWKDKWDTWVPEQPTFIVIDYIYKSKEIIDQLIKRWRPPNDGELSYPVRLLLIDHIFPDNLEDILKDIRFREMSSGGMDWENKKELFFGHKPLQLEKEEHTKQYLSEIMGAGAKIFDKELDESEINEGLKELEETTAAWCPLFAALKGYAVAKEAKSKFGDRRDLIKFYLDTTNRLPWFADNAEDKAIGRAVGSFVAVATLVRNTPFKILVNAFPEQELIGTDLREQFERIISRSRWIVSNGNENTLYAFEPDILGESFFLEFYHHIKYPIDQSSTFIDMLCQASNNEDRYIKAYEFIEFFARISRNLANDDQQDPKIIKYWEMFLDFLNHQDFPENTPIRQAVSIVLINIIKMLEKCGHEELETRCLQE